MLKKVYFIGFILFHHVTFASQLVNHRNPFLSIKDNYCLNYYHFSLWKLVGITVVNNERYAWIKNNKQVIIKIKEGDIFFNEELKVKRILKNKVIFKIHLSGPFFYCSVKKERLYQLTW